MEKQGRKERVASNPFQRHTVSVPFSKILKVQRYIKSCVFVLFIAYYVSCTLNCQYKVG